MLYTLGIYVEVREAHRLCMLEVYVVAKAEHKQAS